MFMKESQYTEGFHNPQRFCAAKNATVWFYMHTVRHKYDNNNT